jgi:hypothetical protein
MLELGSNPSLKELVERMMAVCLALSVMNIIVSSARECKLSISSSKTLIVLDT